MAQKKFLDYDGLLYIWQKLKALFAKQSDMDSVVSRVDTAESDIDTLEGKVEGIISEGGEPNVIESVKVNNTALPVSGKAVNIDLTGYATKATTLSGYGIADAYTKTEVDNAIGALDTGVTSVNGQTGAVTISEASTTAAGLMSSGDKSKLTGIEEGATKTTVDSALSSTSTNPVQNKAINAALSNKAESSTVSAIDTRVGTLETTITGKADSATTLAGYGITDAYTKTEVDDAIGALDTGVTSVNGQTGAVTIAEATTSAAGLMSSGDKTKLNGIESGANKTTVDADLSTTSSNPVKNSAVTTAINAKAPLASPGFSGTPTAPTAASGTNTTQIATTEFVTSAISAAHIGAATFQGTVTAGADISGLTNYKKGWYWVVATAGTYVGQTCEAGDMIFCVSDYSSSYKASDFAVVQSNLDIASITNAEIDTIVAS